MTKHCVVRFMWKSCDGKLWRRWCLNFVMMMILMMMMMMMMMTKWWWEYDDDDNDECDQNICLCSSVKLWQWLMIMITCMCNACDVSYGWCNTHPHYCHQSGPGDLNSNKFKTILVSTVWDKIYINLNCHMAGVTLILTINTNLAHEI